MSTLVIGIDISKKTFDAAMLLANKKVKNKKFDNTKSGFKDFVEWYKKSGSEYFHVCMEATGNYGEALATYLFDIGVKVSVVNPAQIKGFAQSELVRTKNDRADAVLIARFCQAMQPKAWKPAPLHVRELQRWVRRLETLQDMYIQEQNRFEVSSEEIQSSIASVMSKLDEEIKSVKQRIRNNIDNHPDLRDKKKLLETIPGVGDATIAQILSFLSDVKDFSNAKQLAAFIGLNPKQRQSGTSVLGRTRLSKVGDSRLRKALYFPAIVAKRYNPIIKEFCNRLKQSGKATMCIIGAAMRKLVHIIYGVLKSGVPFDVSYAVR